MSGIEGYCMKCKKKRVMTNVVNTTMKNGRPAVKGKCGTCDTKMFKIGTGKSSSSSAKKSKSKKTRKSKKSKKGGASKKSRKSKKSRRSKKNEVEVEW